MYRIKKNQINKRIKLTSRSKGNYGTFKWLILSKKSKLFDNLIFNISPCIKRVKAKIKYVSNK